MYRRTSAVDDKSEPTNAKPRIRKLPLIIRSLTVAALSIGLAFGAHTVLSHAQAAPRSVSLAGYTHVGFSLNAAKDHTRSVAAYWTSARMRSAIPAQLTGAGSPGPATTAGRLAGAGPQSPAAQNPRLAAKRVPDVSSGSAFSSGSQAFTYPYPFDSFKIPVAQRSAYPYDDYGKIFFTNPKNAKNYVCSGTVVTSGAGGNNSVVVTAGHCVVEGGSAAHGAAPNWYTNEAFCPNYQGTVGGVRQCPLGLWTSRGSFSISGWFRHKSFAWDVGALVLNTSGGKTATAALGAQGIVWNDKKPQEFAAFGWPQAAPYNGLDLVQCDASTAEIDPKDKPNLGIGCDMTQGASGGGWMTRWDPAGGGYVDGVNSYKYLAAKPLAMFSPYFTSDNIGKVYNAARVA